MRRDAAVTPQSEKPRQSLGGGEEQAGSPIDALDPLAGAPCTAVLVTAITQAGGRYPHSGQDGGWTKGDGPGRIGYRRDTALPGHP